MIFRFAVNIKTAAGDAIFHFNPRFNDRIILLNSHLRGSWGNEQRISNFPFGYGAPFNLQVMLIDIKFQLQINKNLYCYLDFPRLQES